MKLCINIKLVFILAWGGVFKQLVEIKSKNAELKKLMLFLYKKSMFI